MLIDQNIINKVKIEAEKYFENHTPKKGMWYKNGFIDGFEKALSVMEKVLLVEYESDKNKS